MPSVTVIQWVLCVMLKREPLHIVCRQVVIPMETLSMLGVTSSVAASSASVVQLKTEDSQHSKPMMTSQSTSVVVGSDSSGAASVPQLMSIQPQFIVPLQSGGPSPEPSVIEHDEVSEPKRLRVADEEWTSDS